MHSIWEERGNKDLYPDLGRIIKLTEFNAYGICLKDY
jgi:hypothetical protein